MNIKPKCNDVTGNPLKDGKTRLNSHPFFITKQTADPLYTCLKIKHTYLPNKRN